ncbi:MAG TPA: ribonuclease HII [Gammaproteobacteria bacterium]|jgi:ribonuclease HII
MDGVTTMAMRIIAGVDEAGRGPLAGPVVAAAVVLNPGKRISGLADSKTLTGKQRDHLCLLIQSEAACWALGRAGPEEIDRLNILQATLLAMQRAVAALSVTPHHVQVDGNRCPDVGCSVEAIVQGDATVAAISAASILAKVTRDREMLEWHRHYPQYEFDQHKGYPTPRHRELLARYGPCPLHRHSFAPVAAAARHSRVAEY